MDSFLSRKIDNTPRLNSVPNAIGGADPWVALQKFTSARIAIGRAGGSQRTPSILDFRLAHARARDAVHAEFRTEIIQERLDKEGLRSQILRTMISDRANYLMQPDLGRCLSDESREELKELSKTWTKSDFAIIVSDGLSANAAMLHCVDTILPLVKYLPKSDWSLYPIILVPFARVKIQDDIGEILGVRHTLVLIGERPGLGSPDSLSAYFTYKPKRSSVESDRNCISNIRPLGMPPAIAAKKIAILLEQSRQLKLTGTGLKDNIDPSLLAEDESKRIRKKPQSLF